MESPQSWNIDISMGYWYISMGYFYGTFYIYIDIEFIKIYGTFYIYIYRIYIDISIPPLNPWVGVFPMRFAGAGRVDPSDRRWCAGMGVLEIWRLAN